MSTKETIRLFYPLPLAKVYESVRLETEPRLKVGRLIEFYEETLRYLGLISLAYCDHYEISNERLLNIRSQLDRPTLGTWLKLIGTATKALRSRDRHFLQPPFRQKYGPDEPTAIATQALRKIVGRSPLKRITLSDFLGATLKFRNSKIGHGSLSEAEARHIQPILEAGMNQWLENLNTVKQRHLVYIEKVEWQDPEFSYSGMNLNNGTSMYPLNETAKEAIKPKQVYLHNAETSEYILLTPYIGFDRDSRLVYVFKGLSYNGKPELICPYEASNFQKNVEVPISGTEITGSGVTKSHAKPARAPRAKKESKVRTSMRNWFDIIQPHADIRKGNFDEAVFAADLGDVYSGSATADYNDPYLFYKKTYLTAGLTGLLRQVQKKLTDGTGSAVVQIQTPFGGGKTHSLVAIYHYLRHGKQVQELLPQDVKPLDARVSVTAGNHLNPLEGITTDGVTRYTFWGELAYQLGGKAGYEQLRANDESRISPGKADLRDFLSQYQPFVLLYDEILQYINRALDVEVRDKTGVSLGTQTFSFFQELSEAVATLENGMLIVTLPLSKLEDFGDRQEEGLARLSKIFGRVESIETPVRGEEIYAVIRRRLFDVESLKQVPMREVVHQYFQTYQNHKSEMPPKARDVGYRDKMEKAYPFHPDVIDILYERWSTYSSFQRTRGVLRLLANVIEDLYQRETNIDMILPGDVNLAHQGIRQDLLKHVGVEYEGVIASDISGIEAKAQAMDKSNRSWKHLSERIATAVFFHSFSADDSEKGISLPYIRLAVMRSETIPALVTDILQKQSNALWYLNSRGEIYYFAKVPNLNRMILDKKELYNESYLDEMRKLVEKEAGREFRPFVWPTSGDGIPDNRELKLVILAPDDQGQTIDTWIERKGQSFREYKNTLFFAVADTSAFGRLREDIKTYLALKEIKGEVDNDPKSALSAKRSEIDHRLHGLQNDFSYNVRRMYHTIQRGSRQHDFGQPISGKESLGHWYWEQLTQEGIVLSTLHYRILETRLLSDNEKVSTNIILEQFYKNTRLPVPAQPSVVARAIQLGIQEGAFGLAMAAETDIHADRLRYKEYVPLDVISFEPGFYLVNQTICEALRSKPVVTTENPDNNVGISDDSESPLDLPDPQPDPPTPSTTAAHHRVHLVISDIPANRIADVNRGIFMPLSARSDEPLTFTLTLDVSSSEGISEATLEQKIKETIRQIGARIQKEDVQ